MTDTPATTATKLTIDEPVAPPKNEPVTAELVDAGALLLDVVASCRIKSVGAGVGAGAMSIRQAAVDDAGSRPYGQSDAHCAHTHGQLETLLDLGSNRSIVGRRAVSRDGPGDAWTLRSSSVEGGRLAVASIRLRSPR